MRQSNYFPPKNLQEIYIHTGYIFSCSRFHGVYIIKTGSESIEAILRRRRILFAGFVARVEDTRLPKCVMLGELVGGAGCVGGQEKACMGCFLDDLRAFGINATSGRLQPRTRVNGAERRNKGRSIPW